MAGKHIAIVTDSTCDIPAALIEEYSLVIQSHTLIWGDQQYRDRVDMQPEEFYRRIRVDSVMPTTSQATVADFTTAYQRALEQGADEIVALVLSNQLSGAYQSAYQAAETFSAPVHVYNSRGVTMSLGWQVLAAARAREMGGDAADMLAAADQVRQRVQLIIGLDTLEYLYRGGRIGNARRLVGTMLNIKPVIYVDHESGVVESEGMAVTRRKSLDLVFRKFFEQVGTEGQLHVAVLHGDAQQDADAFAERLQAEYHPLELLTSITGPVLGIHTGPRAIALSGYVE